MSKLTIKTTGEPAVTINRHAIKLEKLVYIACANKPRNYPHGKSRIVYIGTTSAGAARIAQSAAAKAKDLLQYHGVKELNFFVVVCKKKQKVKTWKKLERALILTFREVYGKPPVSNKQGANTKWLDEETYFTSKRLRDVIKEYS